jgi:serine protease Do
MRSYPRFTVLLFALGFLSAGLLLASSAAGETKVKDKDKKKPKDPPKELVVDGQITDNDAKDTKRTEMYCKTYTFKMVKGAKYEIIMRSDDLDSYLRLENPKGDQVAEDDDSGQGNTGLDAKIEYEATETGDFKVIATTFAPGATGKFKLTVKQIGGPAEKGKETSIKLKDGKGSYTGKLGNDDGKFKNKVAKTIEVNLEEGKEYQFDLMSRDFDSYLYLLGPDGAVLAEDDDSGGNLDSRIVHKIAKSGRYRLVVSSFGGSDTGEFTLSVEQK